MVVAFRSGLWCSAMVVFAYGANLSSGYAVDIPSGNTPIVLQNDYPGQADFTIPVGASIVSGNTPITGNDAQNWVITNFGLLSATDIGATSGLQLGAATKNNAIVFNYGTITSAGTTGSAASGVRFTNGGQVTNQAGATISGLDGVHTDGGSVLVNNFGTITGTGATGVYSGVGARVNNFATGIISGSAFGVSCNGAGQCIVDNSGSIHGNNQGLNFVGSNLYSLVNRSTGVITGANQAVRFSGSNGQILNVGLLQSTNANSIAVLTESDGNVYVNAGTIQGGSNGTAFQLTGNNNTIYNLARLIGSTTAVSIIGEGNTLVLGTHVFLPNREIDVTGPGSSITGAIIANGSGNAILLTDSGSESTPFTGFASLTMAGESWTLTNSFTLNGTTPDSISVQSGTLFLNGVVSTSGGATVSGGVLMVGDNDHPSATLTTAGDVAVNAGGTLGGAGTLIGNVVNGGTLTTAAFSSGRQSAFTVQGNVTNSGSIVLAAGAPGNTLTIIGNLISSGGQLVVRTAFGSDPSPTDKLILDGGTATGTTPVVVQSSGTGDGAQTATGIRIIQTINGATTSGASFVPSPSSPGYRTTMATISAGAFDYSLVRGGNGGVADDWYLTSLVAPAPPSPDGGGGGNPGRRIYRPEGGVYLTNEAVARTMFSMTLRDREGYQQPGTAPSGVIGWARITGNRLSGEVAGGSLKLNADSVTAQVGTDLWRFDSKTYGSFRAGIMGGYGAADTSTSSRLLANYKANGNVTGYSVGVYGTWWQNGKGETGAYVDSWAQYNWFNNELRGSGLPKETYDAHAISASIEAGYTFEVMRISGWRVYVEPQIQAIYTKYSADSLTERGGTTVRFQDGGWPTFRAGGRLSGVYTFADGNTLQPYLELNVWHNAETAILMLNRDPVRPDLPKTFGEIKIGAQGTFGKNWSVWGQLSALGGAKNFRQYGGQVGLKYMW